MALARLEALSKDYGGVPPVRALQGIDLAIAEGEFVVILGPSGCGKTTLLRLLAGLEEATVGRCLFREQEIRAPGRKRALVFQEPRLFPWLSVKRNIGLGGGSQAIVDELLELMQLEEFASSYPHQLSGGMARRTALARALAGRPELLLLDEPLSSLDFPTRHRLHAELHRVWRQRGITCVLVTHDLDEALLLASRLVILTPRPGRVLKDVQVPMPFPRTEQHEQYVEWRKRVFDWIMEVYL